jgi:hypothetical protein
MLLDGQQMNKIEFFEWCRDHQLVQTRDIANIFRLSDQTVRNWERHVSEAAGLPLDGTKNLELDYWVDLAIEMFDHYIGTYRGEDMFKSPRLPKLAAMGFSDLKKWQQRHGLATYKDTADQFLIQRQAVHNWLTRDRYPRWLPLACEAINLRKPAKSGKSARQVA